MKNKYFTLFKRNVILIALISVSFLSITFAWFAYSGLVGMKTTIDVTAWYIEFSKDGTAVSNSVPISVDDIHPGMDPVTERIKIKNLGDSAAQVNYYISSARLLDEEIDISKYTEDELKDKLSQDYPFHINMELTSDYAGASDGESDFIISITWPLDSNNDRNDSVWGSDAYNYKKDHPTESSLRVVVDLSAVQYIGNEQSTDPDFTYGTSILYDVVRGTSCEAVSDSCLSTKVVTLNSKIGDDTVTLMPDVMGSYGMGYYDDIASEISTIQHDMPGVSVRSISMKEILWPISKDIQNSIIYRMMSSMQLSNEVLGFIDNRDRETQVLGKLYEYTDYIQFSNSRFPLYSTSSCIWINSEYNDDNAFAFSKIDDDLSKVYIKSKTSNRCKITPVFDINKSDVRSEE